MGIKIRFHGDKAIIRWKTPMEKEFMKRQMTILRDMSKNTNILLKDEDGDEIPRMKMQTMPINVGPKPPISGGTVASGTIINAEPIPATLNSGSSIPIGGVMPPTTTATQEPTETPASPVIVKIEPDLSKGTITKTCGNTSEEKKND